MLKEIICLIKFGSKKPSTVDKSSGSGLRPMFKNPALTFTLSMTLDKLLKLPLSQVSKTGRGLGTGSSGESYVLHNNLLHQVKYGLFAGRGGFWQLSLWD